MTHKELETAHIALCEDIERRAMRIVGLCLAKRVDDAGNAAASLVEVVATHKQQYQMQQEHVAGYDLSALRVDATSASNSETGWERDD